jgi:hypothetical protein
LNFNWTHKWYFTNSKYRKCNLTNTVIIVLMCLHQARKVTIMSMFPRCFCRVLELFWQRGCFSLFTGRVLELFWQRGCFSLFTVHVHHIWNAKSLINNFLLYFNSAGSFPPSNMFASHNNIKATTIRNIDDVRRWWCPWYVHIC